jgi:tRNA-2-methylthio-N6-dimethylallyladenosine synthase
MTLSIHQRAHAFAQIEALGGQMQRHVYIETMGCQMNVYDTERMLEVLGRDGYTVTDDVERADLVLLNTCSIRDRVEHKVLSMLGNLRKLKEHNPDLVLGVTGCVAQQEGQKLLQKVPHLDLVLGPDQIPVLAERVRQIRDDQQRVTATDFVKRKDYDFPEALPPEDGRVTAFVTIMKGCNKVCAFCIVPFTRGREVSKPAAQVLDEVRMLVCSGVREVTLLGQNVNSYGKDRGAELDFAELLAAVNEVEGLERIRFTTSHPMDCTDSLIEAFGTLPKLAPFFHLPIQAGSEKVLEAMRRHHRVDDYLEKITRLRTLVPDVALSTDIIVGFPGETEADFDKTLDLLAKVKYASIFSFMYSARPGTRAADLEDDVPLVEKKRRLAAVQVLQDGLTREWMAGHLAREVEVLFEGPSRVQSSGPNSMLAQYQDGPPQVTGRTPENVKVNVPIVRAGDLLEWKGRLGRVRIDRVNPHSLQGTLLGLL